MKNFLSVVLMGGAAVVAWLLNYYYHPLMISYLSTAEFAEFESLVGTLNILGVLTSGMSLFLVREMAKNAKEPNIIKSLFVYSHKRLFLLGCLCYLGYALFAPFTASFLKLENAWPVLLVWVSILFSWQGTVVGAVLQGFKKFHFIAFGGVMSSLARLVFGFLFVYFGYRVYGAIWGFIASSACVFLMNLSYVWTLLRPFKADTDVEKFREDFRTGFPQMIQFFLLALFLSILMNIDIIFAKNLYDPETAGMYASVSIIAKFLLFMGGSVETVYFTQIMEHQSKKNAIRFIQHASLLLVVLSLCAAVSYFFGGKYVLDFIKSGLSSHWDILGYGLLFSGLYTFVSLYCKVLIGWKVHGINYVIGWTLAGLVAVLMYTQGVSLQSYVSILIVGIGMILLVATAMLWYTIRNASLWEDAADLKLMTSNEP